MLDPIPVDKISPPAKKEFYKKYVSGNRPVVIKGLLNDWPAVKRWDFKYFIENFGDIKANIARVKESKGYLNAEEGIIMKDSTFKEVLPIIDEGHLEDSWTISTPAGLLPQPFFNDYTTPEYCAGGRFLSSRMFLGAKGLITPLHQDLPENMYATIKGKKHITLFAPSAPVYPYPRYSRLPNFSQVDVGDPDYQRFPQLAKAQPYTTELDAGEILYIPSFWWHYFRNLESSIAINFWWAVSWRIPIVWAGTVYGKLRSLGNHNSSNK